MISVDPSAFAEAIRPLLAQAKTARGRQSPSHPSRVASDRVNALLLEYDRNGGNVSALSRELGDELSLASLRRRLGVARSGKVVGRPTGTHGVKDPKVVKAAADRVRAKRGRSDYGQQIYHEYSNGISLSALANELGLSYSSVYMTMMRSS